MGPQIFFGQPDSAIPDLVAFWIVFYVWIGSEMFLGWKLRPTAGAVDSDAGSKWMLIGSIWLGLRLGLASPCWRRMRVSRATVAFFSIWVLG